MGRPTVELELDPAHARDLAAGGVFVVGCGLRITEECELLVRGAAGELPLVARVVFVDPAGRGAGLEVVGFGPELRQRIAELAMPPPPPPEDAALDLETVQDDFSPGAALDFAPEPALALEIERELDLAPADASDIEATQPISLEEMDDDTEAEDDPAGSKAGAPRLHERMRGLTLVQQLKFAHQGEMQERILLERLYGKAVWEALLRNPRITAQEVARIARMGALPRPLLETICGNGGWLQVPEVRRALLTHPRLTVDQITRVLRLLPKHELKLAVAQTAYPLQVREHARRLLRTP